MKNKVPWVKLSIPKAGLYRLALKDLESIGLKVSAINPETFHLFNQGKEVPVQLDIQSPGKTDSKDEIIFYGADPDSQYTDTNIYWLTWGNGMGLQLPVDKIPNEVSPNAVILNNYPEKIHWEEKSVFEDWSESNPNSQGEWFWKEFTVNMGGNIRIDLSHIENTKLYQEKVPIEIQFHGQIKT